MIMPLASALREFEIPANSSFVQVMIKMKEMVIHEATPMFDIAGIIACIGGIITTVRVCAGIMNGRQFSVWEIIKPLVVIALCFDFSLVTRLLDIVPNGVSKIATEMCVKNRKEDTVNANLKAMFVNLAKAENEQEEKNTKKFSPNSKTGQTAIAELGNDFIGPTIESSSVAQDNSERIVVQVTNDDGRKNFFQKCAGFLKSAWGVVNDSLTANVCQWACGVMNLVFPIVIGVAQIMLAILAFLGPFALAFCNFPGLGGFKTWVVKYIHTSFWMPVTSILYFINIEGMEMLLSMRVTAGTLDETLSQLGGQVTAMLIFKVVMLFAVFKVPTYANYVVDSAISSGLGGAMQKIKEIGMRVATKGASGGGKKFVSSSK